LQPDRLPHQPSCTIALDGIADAFAGSETETALGKVVGQDHQDQQTVFVAATLSADLLKAFLIPKTVLPAHGTRQMIRRSGVCGRADAAA